MFDAARFNNMPKFDEFNYWFIRDTESRFNYGLKQSFIDKQPEILGEIEFGNMSAAPADVQKEFAKFMTRPEYTVGSKFPLNTTSATCNDPGMMIDGFEDRIVGLIFIKALYAGRNPDDNFSTASRFLDWIRSTDFYRCPGSTRFHDAEPCGLLFHTLNVYNNMIELRKVDKFSNTDYASITLIALCHDLTKIGNYEFYYKNVKDDASGNWNQIPAYRWKCNPFPFGHGVASMYIVTQFFHLTIDEMLGIRWHMGEYRVASQEVGELEDACENYPVVRMIQFADQLACAKF